MNNAYVEAPRRRAPHPAGSSRQPRSSPSIRRRRTAPRQPIVAAIKGADQMDFKNFIATYDEIIRQGQQAHARRLRRRDRQPHQPRARSHRRCRAMPGQASSSAWVPRVSDRPSLPPTGTIADLGISKTMTISSTYDHRIIQGAESGLFLKKVHDMLLGGDRFYEDIFAAIGVPYTPVQWHTDDNPVDREESAVTKQMKVLNLINMYRGAATSSPTSTRSPVNPPQSAPRARPGVLRPQIWDNTVSSSPASKPACMRRSAARSA